VTHDEKEKVRRGEKAGEGVQARKISALQFNLARDPAKTPPIRKGLEC